MSGIIYKVTNLINQKIYIGQTQRAMSSRWKEHIQKAFYENKTYFQHAIVSYGPDNFKIEKIDEAQSKEELNKLEKYYIAKFDSMNPLKGYNLAPGGECGMVTSVCQLDLDGKLIQKFESIAEASQKVGLKAETPIVACCKNKYSTSAGYQWCYTKDLSDRLGKKAKVKKQTNIPVKQYDLNGNFIKQWECIKLAGETLSINPSKISAVCRGKRKSTGGYVWKYIDEENLNKNISHIFQRKVEQYSLDGKYIKTYETINKAALNIGQSKGGHISDVCKGKRKTCGGFIWKYAS